MMKLFIKNVGKEFDGKQILRNITVEINSPCILLIVGPNGSGKTTLIKIIAGLIAPSKGNIEIYKDNKLVKDKKREIGFVSHYPIIYDELTVKENLDFYAKLYGIKDFLNQLLIKDIVYILGLNQVLDTKTFSLSYGWKKKVDIARALVHNPNIVLFDEPFTGLDENGKKSLTELFDYLIKLDKIIILTSPIHDVLRDVSGLKSCLIVKELDEGVLN